VASASVLCVSEWVVCGTVCVLFNPTVCVRVIKVKQGASACVVVLQYGMVSRVCTCLCV
jgi:hypothetical protein